MHFAFMRLISDIMDSSSTLRCGGEAPPQGRPRRGGGQLGRSTSKGKRVPQLGRVSTFNSDPITSTSVRLIATEASLQKTRPLPLAAGRSGWYSVLDDHRNDTLPLSRTANSSRAWRRSCATISTYPCSVNLKALVARLILGDRPESFSTN